jgi:DNA mismatch endonuclease (patch repair protein)
MLANRRRDTQPELRVRRKLHAAGLRYRVDFPLDLPPPIGRRRRADIAFPRDRVAIFIDGCFWHGCEEH